MNKYKWRLFLFGDVIFESNDELVIDAYIDTYNQYLKQHIIKEQNTLMD